jgi:two-component system LytT family response regulator
LIVDDEPLARNRLARMLTEHPEIEVVGTAADGVAALAAIERHNPSLAFLDVQMPRLDGLAMLERLPLERLPLVVFTTAHDQYAARAFELHAVDYLLKPFDEARLAEALRRVRARCDDGRRAEFRDQMAALLDELRTTRAPGSCFLTKLLVRQEERTLLVPLDDVDWLGADDKHVSVHAGKHIYLMRDTLSRLESLLDPRRFVRVHRSALVQLERVTEIHPTEGGDYEAVLRDGARLPLSRRQFERVAALLGRPL